MKFYKKIKSSLSIKLVLMFFIASVVLSSALWFAVDQTFKYYYNQSIRPYLSRYVFNLQREIGYPPNIKKAEAIASNLNVKIFILTDDNKNFWSSTNEVLELTHFNVRDISSVSNQYKIEEGYYEGDYFMRFHFKDVITVFILDDKVTRAPNLVVLAIILVCMLLIMLVLYLFIRYLFSPIHEIEKGVKVLGDGSFSNRLSIKRNDELGSLASSVNKMAKNIENMLEAKRQLLLAISHELRTPITRSKIALSLMDDSSSKASLEEDLKEMEVLIHELLETERLKENHSPLDLTLCNINDIVYQVCGRYFVDDNIELTLDEQVVSSMLDAKRISLVVKNLIKNAITAQKSPNQSVHVATQYIHNKIILTVTDNGIGIAKEDIDLITEPFYRIDSSRQRKTGGYGIGLYLIKLIVLAHNGKLVIESELNKGTDIHIVLPVKQHEQENEQQ